jgi:hypothetical protein
MDVARSDYGMRCDVPHLCGKISKTDRASQLLLKVNGQANGFPPLRKYGHAPGPADLARSLCTLRSMEFPMVVSFARTCWASRELFEAAIAAVTDRCLNPLGPQAERPAERKRRDDVVCVRRSDVHNRAPDEAVKKGLLFTGQPDKVGFAEVVEYLNALPRRGNERSCLAVEGKRGGALAHIEEGARRHFHWKPAAH